VTFFQRKINFVPNHFANGPYDEKGVSRKKFNYLEKKIPKICHCGNDDAPKMGVQTFSHKII
jgi:hypothetical protein